MSQHDDNMYIDEDGSSSPNDAPSVRFVTLGCAKNEVDSDKMRAALVSAGFETLESDDDALPDVVVVNTCSFITEATQESIDAIFKVLEQREELGSDTLVVVAGCLPSRYGTDLAEEIPEVDAFVPVLDESNIVELIGDLTGYQATSQDSMQGERGDRTFRDPYAYVKISDGCDRNCAFCTIPSIRGHYASRYFADILQEVGELVKMGTHEVILIGQDTGIWGDDIASNPTAWDGLDAPNLASLLGKLADLFPQTWFRVMYLQPQRTDDELLDAIALHDNVCSYLDIPLQHCNARVLHDMNRAGSREEYLALLDRIRDKVGDDVTIRTTFIAGFPGETEEESEELLDFIEEAGFDFAGVFEYSREDGTVAGDREDQVPAYEIASRAQALRDAAEEIGFAKAQQHVGQIYDVLICGEDMDDDGTLWGRTMFQAPDVDSTVTIAADDCIVGQVVPVRITGSYGYDLEGELV